MRMSSLRAVARTVSLLAIAGFAPLGSTPASATDEISLSGHFAPEAQYAAKSMGEVPAGETVRLAITLPLHNEAELDNLIARLYDPKDPLYGKFLTPQQFADKFGPTREEYNYVMDYIKSTGMSVMATHPNRMVVDVAAPAQAVENAFGVRLAKFKAADGHVIRTPNAEPRVPAALAGHIKSIVGLADGGGRRPQSISRGPANLVAHAATGQELEHPADAPAAANALQPSAQGTGPGGSLTPSDIKKVYSLSGVNLTGAGQSLALCEFDGYTPSDIAQYESAYGIPNIPLQDILLDGATGAAGSASDEVTLDIELMMALAPGASKIYVYEAPNTDAGMIDTLNRIVSDNAAKQISTSWGITENYVSPTTLNAEQAAFKQMAAQGQSFYAASGDSGAYANGSTLSVQDPASQPYVTAVGGTTLTLNSDHTYNRESTWNNGSITSGASGGGISVVWSKPTWQNGFGVSSTMRDVPDVSLDGDANTGYSIYWKGGWYIYGGTSCAAPLWAAFTAVVNQQRVTNGKTTLGFANPTLYQIAGGSRYSSDFHDIADNSSNLYYHATTGCDDATGLGSFIGANLLADLAGSAPASPPSAPTGLTATAQGSSQIALSWTASASATGYNVMRSTSSTGTYQQVASTASTSYTDSNLSAATTYYYQVCAANSGGASAYASPVSATTAAPPTSTSTTTVSLPAVANVYVRGGTYAGANYAGQALQVKHYTDPSWTRATYLKFDLTSVTSAPTSAKLTLTQSGGSPSGASATLSVYGVPDTAWTETGLTWNTALANDQLTTGGTSTGTFAASTVVSTNTGPYTWDLSQYLANKAGKVVTLMIVDNNADSNYFQFNARSASTGAPVLTLTLPGSSTSTGTTPTGTPTGTSSTPGPVTLSDIADSYVRGSSYASTNYGSDTTLYVKRFGGDMSFSRVTYLKFDLSSVTTVPTSAVLSLTLTGTSAGSGVPVKVFGVADTSWTESGITWNSAMASDALTSACTSTGTLAATTNVGPSLQPYTWDVTSYIASNLGKVVTLQVIDDGVDGNYFTFNSKEAASGRPSLTFSF